MGVQESKVKRRRARLVLGWGTAWEDLRVLSALYKITRRCASEIVAERHALLTLGLKIKISFLFLRVGERRAKHPFLKKEEGRLYYNSVATPSNHKRRAAARECMLSTLFRAA